MCVNLCQLPGGGGHEPGHHQPRDPGALADRGPRAAEADHIVPQLQPEPLPQQTVPYAADGYGGAGEGRRVTVLPLPLCCQTSDVIHGYYSVL